ncbi:MAG: phage GP46 family protein [Methyloversatilis sp.]|uniref:phage GP46 family protein n=1 Tax=Methyloversatilis sp. TaxID=2569862 RepID=UPI002736F0CA|nr:phage GP46 family protein [Methyloversatilis sp.]MDP3871312.1 phage GP46 family protein [Methyloversatilis sp.]
MQPRIDPATGLYDGTRITHLGNAVWLRIMTPLGSWWARPEVGSRLHELQRQKALPRIAVLAEQYAEAALADLVRDGRAQSVSARAQINGGRVDLTVEVIDSTGRQWSYAFSQVLH